MSFVIVLLRNCQAFQQTLFDSNRVYINEMVSITRLQSNQAVLAMVYPRVAFMEKNEKFSKILSLGLFFVEKLCHGGGSFERKF